MVDLSPLIDAARRAADLCQAVQRQHIVKSEKKGYEPVTIADYGAQAIIARALQLHFPDDGVISEESGEQFLDLVDDDQRAVICALFTGATGVLADDATIAGWLDHGKSRETPQMWTIDPIDGTKGFVANRHYVNAIGLLKNRKPAGAVIAAPAYNDGVIFYTRGGDAYCEPLTKGAPRRLGVSANAAPPALRGLESVEKSHSAFDRMARVRELVGVEPDQVERIDSMEKYARVASGAAELYMRLPRITSTRPHSIWDHAPGVALLEAAGGRASDVDGTPLDFSAGTAMNNQGIIATNGPIHAQVIEAVQQLLAEERDSHH